MRYGYFIWVTRLHPDVCLNPLHPPLLREVTVLTLWENIALFVVAGGAITWAGTQLAGLADRLADRTGMGEALAGTLFLGVVTSLAGLAVSLTAALEGRPALAISNALGGIAVQTAFLALADISYRKANLEHATASLRNIAQIALLVITLALILLALAGPQVSLGPVHPVTPMILLVLIVGAVIVYRIGENPMWTPRNTKDTVTDDPEPKAQNERLAPLIIKFTFVGTVVLLAGVAVAHTTGIIADKTGISESVAGAMISGVVTSLPELVTTLAAVRRGALTLAVADIVGGNTFDMMFIVVVDIAYLSGSAFGAPTVGMREIFLVGLIILLNVILLLGMLYRQTSGPGNIGLESVLVLVTYVGGFVVLASMGQGG